MEGLLRIIKDSRKNQLHVVCYCVKWEYLKIPLSLSLFSETRLVDSSLATREAFVFSRWVLINQEVALKLCGCRLEN